MNGPTSVSIFLSSPADVAPEREAAEWVVQRLNGVYAAHVELVAKRWERHFYEADRGFQEAIAPIEAFDMVVGILWKRIGSELPPGRFRRPDGMPYESGTVYEIETALAASRLSGCPSVYVFKSQRPITYTAERVDEERAQKEALDRWWGRTFRDEAGHYVAATNSFGDTEEFEAKFENCLVGWLRDRGHIPCGPVWDVKTQGSPYPGLVAYDREYSPVFFGRHLAVESAREELLAAVVREDGLPALFVIGASGSGKSSLVRAGLVPRLTRPGIVPGVDVWRTVITVPAANSLGPLATHLYAPDGLPELAASAQGDPERWARMAAGNPETAADSLAWALDRIGEAERQRVHADRRVEARLLLVVDQLEGLFGTPGQEAFAKVLRALVGGGRVWLLASLRSDRYADLQLDRDLLPLKRAGATYDLPPPGPAEIADIVKGPARAAGLTFAERDGGSLARVLVEAAPNADALPLLQMALAQLFKRREGAELTFAAYEAMDGVEGAIAAYADSVFAAVPLDAQRELDALVRELVRDVQRRSDGQVHFTTRSAGRRAFETSAARGSLVATLVDNRLLVSDEGNLRVAHEALLRRWDRARTGLERLADAELRKERRRRQRAAIAAGVFLLVAAGAGVATYFAFENAVAARHQTQMVRQERDRAKQQLAEARASLIWSKLEFRADQLLPHEVDALWDLAAEPAVQTAFLRQMAENRPLVLKFVKHPEPVLRTFGLELPAGQAQTAFESILEAMRVTTNYGELEALAQTLQTLGSKLTAEQAQTELGPTLKIFMDSLRGEGLFALAQTLQTLGSKLTAEQAQTALRTALVGALVVSVSMDERTDLRRRDPFSLGFRLEALVQTVQTLGSKFTAEQAQTTLDSIIESMKDIVNPQDHSFSSVLGALALLERAFGSKIATEQVGETLDVTLDVMKGNTSPDELRTLAKHALPIQLTAEQAQTALGPILDAMKGNTSPDVLQTLAEAVQALPIQLTAEQAQIALGPILEAMRGAADLMALAEVVRTLEPKLAAEQTQTALDRVLETMNRVLGNADSGSNELFADLALSNTLSSLARTAYSLAPRLTADQAQSEFGPILEVMRGTTTRPLVLRTLAEAVQALPIQLTDEQAHTALGPILDAMKGNTSPDVLQTLAEAVQALPIQLTDEQAHTALDHLLKVMLRRTDPNDRRDLVAAVQAIESKLTIEQAYMALGPVLGAMAIGSRNNLSALPTLEQTAQVLGSKLTAEQAQMALDRVPVAMQAVDDRDEKSDTSSDAPPQEPLREVLLRAWAAMRTADEGDAKGDTSSDALRKSLLPVEQILWSKLTAEQAQMTLEQVLKVRVGDRGIDRLVMAKAVQTLGPKLTAEQAQMALDRVLGGMKSTAVPDELLALAQAVQALPIQLTDQQAQTALDMLLHRIREEAGSNSPERRQALAQALQALGPKLTAEKKAGILPVARSGLAAACSDDEAIAWAGMLEALLPPQPVNSYVEALSEALKYPTIALGEKTTDWRERDTNHSQPASASEYLLRRLPLPTASAPQNDALVDAVDWIARTYPNIDLTRPPMRPAPLIEIAFSALSPSSEFRSSGTIEHIPDGLINIRPFVRQR